MKKIVAFVLIGGLLFAALGMFTAGSASAGGTSYAPLAAGTATPAGTGNRLPPAGVLPVGGGEVDLSGTWLVIGLGSLLVLVGFALRTRVRHKPQA